MREIDSRAVEQPKSDAARTLRVLGTRGIPAEHGGFETFAERLALHLQAHGWNITVYCQEGSSGSSLADSWRGIQRIRIPVSEPGALGTIVFDWLATWDAARAGEPCLTLGYNTAAFSTLLRLKAIPNVINMDGLEWRRKKWGLLAKLWFYLNDWAGCWLGDHLVADHPAIKTHLMSRVRGSKISVIPYGADLLEGVNPGAVTALGLTPGRYLTLIARPEPENSVLELVTGFSRSRRGVRLAVLGRYEPERNPYHAQVMASASNEVSFLGPIYDPAVVQALRFHCVAYLHGHQVGGTNPSLVEALGAGNAILAHDNQFNRWVAGPEALYFSDAQSCGAALDTMLTNASKLRAMSSASKVRHQEAFRWEDVLDAYERLLGDLVDSKQRAVNELEAERWR